MKKITKPNRSEQIMSQLNNIQARIESTISSHDSFSMILRAAYLSTKQWEKEILDVSQQLSLVREQANAASQETLPVLGATLDTLLSNNTGSVVSVGYGSAKKEQQLVLLLQENYRKKISIIGIERDYGITQDVPDFLQQEPNRFIFVNSEDKRPYREIANVDGSNAIGLMMLAAHHTLLELPQLLRKFKGMRGLILAEELITDVQWKDTHYRIQRAVIEVLFNYAFKDEYPKDFDFLTQLNVKYYTREEVEQAGGTIIDIPHTTIPPVSLVVFAEEDL